MIKWRILLDNCKLLVIKKNEMEILEGKFNE